MKSNIYNISLLLLFFATNARGQQSFIAFEEARKPLIVFIFPPDSRSEVLKSIEGLHKNQHDRYHYFLIEDETHSKIATAKKINDMLNSVFIIDKQRVYCIEWHKNTNDLYFKKNEKNIFADTYFHLLDDKNKPFSLETVLNSFIASYLWEIDIEKIKATSEKETPQLRPFNFGLLLGFNWQNNFDADTFRLPTSMSRIGIMMGYRLNKRLYLNSTLSGSWSLPDQSGQQSSLFNSIDISTGGKQTINIGLKMHVAVQGTFQANYFLTSKNPRLRPYIGLGIAGLFLMQADTTISQEIDVSSIFSGGGQPNFGGAGGAAGGLDNLNLTRLSTFAPLIDVGINYKLARSVNLLCSVAYQHRFKTEFRGIRATNRFSDVSLNFGMQFEIAKKTKQYYKYVR